MSKKHAWAVALGRKGGRAKVPKGFARASPEKLKEWSAKGVAARRKKARVRVDAAAKQKDLDPGKRSP